MQVTIDNIIGKDNREIKEVNLALIEYIINDLHLLKHICLKDVESKILEKFGILSKNNKKYMSAKFIIEEINFYKENGYMFSEGDYLFLTEKFYDYVIENYEIEEDMLPNNYENISDEIKKRLNKIKKEDNIDPMMKMINKSIKMNKFENNQKQKEINKYTVNLINKILKK